jgi:Tol biopolymer transport system component
MSVRMVGGVLAAVAAAVVVGGASARPMSLPVAAEDPAYSPDGSQIAYATHQLGGPRGWLIVAGADGTHPHSVYSSTDSCCEPVAWASTQQLVFVDDYQLKTVDLHTRKATLLASGAAYFFLSPNRQTVAIADGCECNHAPDAVALVGVDGHGYRLIPKPKNRTDELDGFSPDGTELVFTRYPYTYDNPRTNEPSLHAVSVRGGAPVPISNSALIGTSHLPPDADDITWSPDGRWLSYFTPKGLWIENTTSGSATLAASAHGAGSPERFMPTAWSPSSRSLAYVSGYQFGKRAKAGQKIIERLVLATTAGKRRPLWSSSLTYLTDSPGEPPQWSPNGNALVFLARPTGNPLPAKLYTVNTSGRRPRQIG